MILDLKHTHIDFFKHIWPFTKRGVFIDTSVMKIFIDGFIKWKFSKILNQEYQDLSDLFEALKLTKWNKLWITPHVLTETCRHLYCDYNRNQMGDFKKIVQSIIPILKKINEEEQIKKEEILKLINPANPVIEIGDLSIFVAVDNLIESSNKTAILVKDEGFNDRYENHPKIMIIDYYKTTLDLKT